MRSVFRRRLGCTRQGLSTLSIRTEAEETTFGVSVIRLFSICILTQPGTLSYSIWVINILFFVGRRHEEGTGVEIGAERRVEMSNAMLILNSIYVASACDTCRRPMPCT